MDEVSAHRADLDLLYPLADALQMKLFLNVTEKEGRRIKGADKLALKISDTSKFKIPFEVKVHASAVHPGKEAWLLASVRCDLWILLGYMKSSRELQFCIVDSSKGHFGPMTSRDFCGLTLSELANKLGPAIVAAYFRRKDETEWEKIGASYLDEGQGREAEGQPSATVASGKDIASSH